MTTNTMNSRSRRATTFPGGELYVSPTPFIQTAENRFGPAVLDDLKTFVNGTPQEVDVEIEEDSGVDEEDEDDPLDQAAFLAVNEWVPQLGTGHETDHAQHGFPRIGTTRNNLTALSQRYNLYFAAYQDRIYVYRPQRASPQILPPPTLILHPPPSEWAERCHGALDHRFPHQVNHIIVGNLGDFEIVLLSYDDGDALAYYTHNIVHYIRESSGRTRGTGQSSTSQGTVPRPFFHDNVGESAWGLAVHEKSRLIAVSSNLHEVTVFAFALAGRNNTTPRRRTERHPIPVHAGCGHSGLDFQKDFRSRARAWRIVLPLGTEGSNVPNVSFMDDEMGEAEKVVAIDVTGSVWFLDIWRLGVPHVRWPDSYLREPYMSTVVRGWGVLMLPYRSFRPTKSVRELLGAPSDEVVATKKEGQDRIWLDTTCGLYYIKGFASNMEMLFRQRHARVDYAKIHGAGSGLQEREFSGGWESESELDAEESTPTASTQTTGPQTTGTQATGTQTTGTQTASTQTAGTQTTGTHTTGTHTIGTHTTGTDTIGTHTTGTHTTTVQSITVFAPAGDTGLPPHWPLHDLTATMVACWPDNRRPDKPPHTRAPEFQLAQCIIPNTCDVVILGDSLEARVNFTRLFMERKRKTRVIRYARTEDLPAHLTKTHCLLRTAPADVELQPFDFDSPAIELNYLLTQQRHVHASPAAAGPPPWDLHPIYSERISMLQHVPELSLVVAGSPTGRVALLTLTQSAAPTEMGKLRYGFRVECVLPRRDEECINGGGGGGSGGEGGVAGAAGAAGAGAAAGGDGGGKRTVQPACTLIGIAMSPAPRQPRLGGGVRLPPKTGADGKALPLTYRLILHYKDHTILMYDVRREKEELLVF